LVAEDGPGGEELKRLQEQFAALPVDDVLASSASTIASLAYAKLEAQELAEAKKAIDALQSLVPHVGGDLGQSLKSALTDLQVAYVAAT
jgi:enhancing lycopene biosynthesis protein 2